MGWVLNGYSIGGGIFGLVLGYIYREGFCSFTCINDSFTIKSMLFFAFGLFLAGILYNFLFGKMWKSTDKTGRKE